MGLDDLTQKPTDTAEPILTFEEEFGAVSPASISRDMVDGDRQLSTQAVTPNEPTEAWRSNTDNLKAPVSPNVLRRRRKFGIAALVGVAVIIVAGPTVQRIVTDVVQDDLRQDKQSQSEAYTAAVDQAANEHIEGSQPVATFTIEGDTTMISQGVEAYKSTPGSLYANESKDEQLSDDDILHDTGTLLSAQNSTHTGETYGIYNGRDVDNDGDDDLYVEKVDSANK